MQIKEFYDLMAWKKSHELVIEIYKITKTFPDDERFGLTSQIRRSASSITANLAEGYGRFHFKDKIRFYYMARGSNTETQNHLILAKDLVYLSENIFFNLMNKLVESNKLINGLIRGVENTANK